MLLSNPPPFTDGIRSSERILFHAENSFAVVFDRKTYP
jgi:hypothetical protein